MKSSTETLITALRILARDIQSGDGVANAAIAEAADRLAELEREVAELRQKFATIPDDVWSKADLVKQVHQALAERDDADRKNLALRNEIARLNGQTVWVCACGGTDCAGQKENAELKIERNRLRRALLDCSDAAVGGSTLATWIRGKVAATLGKEAQPIRADHIGDLNEMMQAKKEAQP